MLALALVLVVVVVGLAVLALASAVVSRQRVIAAADAAALAAADTALGVVPGLPCENAGRVARAHGTRLSDCSLDGAVATVEAEGSLAGIPIRARSRAGPPPGSGYARR